MYFETNIDRLCIMMSLLEACTTWRLALKNLPLPSLGQKTSTLKTTVAGPS